VLPGALVSTEDISGQTALTPMFPGEQVIAGKWGANAGAVSPLGIPEDRLAVSAQLGDPNRVAGFVQPGSRVAIWLTTGEAEETKVQLLLDDVTVLGAGDTTATTTTVTDPSGAQTTESLPKTLLTLSVDQEQAEKIILGGKTGELWFGLLTEKSKVTYGGGLSAQELFE
jgi:pilus assembly protein CpaB